MALQSWLHGLQAWTSRHPWLTTSAIVVIGTTLLWLLPPHDSLGATVANVAFMLAITFGLNFLIYRNFFPSRYQVQDERRKADEIAASVRRAREQDSLL